MSSSNFVQKGAQRSFIQGKPEPNVDIGREVAQQYRGWICDERVMALTSERAIYMHCLPADRGSEVTDTVIDGPQSRVYPEAENRMHTAKALMALTMKDAP